MKALHVIPAIAPRYGGPSQAIVALCAALRARGVETLIASTDADGPRHLVVPLGVETTWRREPAVFFRRQASDSFHLSLPLSAWLRTHVARFDVVHVHAVFGHACFAAGRAARRARVPYVVRPLGTLDPWSLAQKRLKKRLFWLAGGRRLVAGAAAVHYTTTAERDLAEHALGLSRGVVVPNGVDPLFMPGPPDPAFAAGLGLAPGERFVLVLSRLHPKKGLDLLIPAFAAAARSLPGVRLVIAGDGEPAYVAELRAAAERLAPGRIVFAGWLEADRRLAALRGAALLALASRQENFGLAVAEAMGCGTPVLVSEGVNLADDVRAAEAGWVVPLEAAALERALGSALQDPAELARRGAAGARLVDARFRWSAAAAALVSLYEEIVATSR